MQFDAAYPELEVLSESDPKSLVNLLPASIGNYLKLVPDELWLKTDSQLFKDGKCNEYDSLLRHAFWIEYDRAIRAGQKMNATNIFAGIVNKSYFFKEICTNTSRLAFLATPPTDYNTRLEELLTQGLQQYREILMLPNLDDKGRVDGRLIAVKQRIIEDVANRRRGGIINRMEVQSKNLNVNVEHNTQKPKEQTVEEMEAELARLEAQKQHLLPESTGGVSYAREETTQHEVIEVYAEKEL